MICELCLCLIRDLTTKDITSNWLNCWNSGPLAPVPVQYLPSDSSYDTRYRFQHYRTLGQLQESASTCAMCGFLNSFAEQTWSNKNTGTAETKTYSAVPVSDLEEDIGRWNERFYFYIGHRCMNLQLYLISDDHTAADQADFQNSHVKIDQSSDILRVGRPVSFLQDDHDITKLANLVATWLMKCRETHRPCKQVQRFIPTRVLDVGPPDGSQLPFLYITSDVDVGAPFLALSYCWGKQSAANMTLKTTEDNFPDRLRGISMENLPACFRDSVTITRKLGIRFLWIDALCIIQDQESQSDWIVESSKMAQVYSNSILTISAVSSGQCTTNFLSPRTTADVGVSMTVNFSGRQRRIGVRECPTDLPEVLDLAPITKRGWTVQERMLSCRVLHFADRQVYFQCAQGTYCEDGREQLSIAKRLGSDPGVYVRPFLWPIVFGGDLHVSWYQIVMQHSELQFTQQDDRLPSLAGLAQAYSRATRSKYLAGLWESELPKALLWRVFPFGDNSQRPAAHQKIPSWSWASVSPMTVEYASVVHNGHEGRQQAKVTFVSIEADSEAEGFLGIVRNGRIGLCGKFKQLRYYMGCLMDESENFDVESMGVHNGSSSRVDVDRTQFGPTLCWCMPIYKEYSSHKAHKELHRYHMLLMKEVDHQQRTFKRFGIADLNQTDYAKLFRDAARESIKLV